MIFNRTLKSIARGSLLKPREVRNNVKKPLIVFSFDDGRSTDYTIAYPIMSNLGIKGTSNIITSFVGRDGYLTWSQIKEMKASGWDFQCHTHDHADLTTLTEAQIRLEMENVNNAFTSHELELPKHHAYPRGITNELVTNIISEYRLTQRLTGIDTKHLNDYSSINANSLQAVSVDTQNDDRLSLVKSVINTGFNSNKVMILYCHKIVNEYDGYDYQMMQSYFEEILGYIKSIGVETLTISEMYDRVFNSN